MKITACYITAEVTMELKKSIQSLQKSVDEIIIVFTGEIGNIHVVEVYGARTYSCLWQDDFSAPRNFAISKATGDWIVFLDTDEYFCKMQTKNLYQIIDFYGKNKDALFVKMINIDQDRDNMVVDAFFALRIFRRKKSLYYVGRIHEQLTNNGYNIERIAQIPETELYLYHTGYSSLKLKEKAERNLKMLLKELEYSATPDKLYMYLAEAYDGVGDTENAVKYARLDIVNGRQKITYASRSYRILLKILGNQAINKSDICGIAKQAVVDFPELPEFHAEYATCLAALFQYDKAIDEMKKAINCKDNYTSIEPSIFDDQACLLAEKLIIEWQECTQRKINLKISACVIIKNEELEIGRWIENMRACTDEQIIVDTGSEDHTVNIAESYGVKVYHYNWKDDFSAAKNFAIEQAKGDWIIFLDADESFTPETVKNVRNIIAEKHGLVNDVDAIMCPIINIDADQNNIELSRFVNIRLFRNIPQLRYKGNVHEGIRHSERGLKVYIEKARLAIYHTGYSTNRVQKKLQRNLQLLQQDIDLNGEGPQHYRYLMDCYQGMGEHEKAIKYAKFHLRSKATSVGSESDIYRTIINSMIFLKKKDTEIETYIVEALNKFPGMPDFYAYYAASYFRQENFSEAKKYLLKALDIYNNKNLNDINSTSFMYILSEVYSYLSEIFYIEKNEEKSRYYIDLALKENKYNTKAFAQLCKLWDNVSLNDLVKVIDKYYQVNKNDIVFVVNRLDETDKIELYFYYADILEQKYNIILDHMKLYSLLIKKEYEKTYQTALKKAKDNIMFLVYSLLCMGNYGSLTQIKSLLPESFFRCVQAYYHPSKKLKECDYDGYISILSVIICFGNKNVINKFIRLGECFFEKHIVDIVKIISRELLWEEVKTVFDQYVISKENRTSEFFRLAGMCAYNMKEFKTAEQYFYEAIKLEGNLKEISAYMHWIKN